MVGDDAICPSSNFWNVDGTIRHVYGGTNRRYTERKIGRHDKSIAERVVMAKARNQCSRNEPRPGRDDGRGRPGSYRRTDLFVECQSCVCAGVFDQSGGFGGALPARTTDRGRDQREGEVERSVHRRRARSCRRQLHHGRLDAWSDAGDESRSGDVYGRRERQQRNKCADRSSGDAERKCDAGFAWASPNAAATEDDGCQGSARGTREYFHAKRDDGLVRRSLSAEGAQQGVGGGLLQSAGDAEGERYSPVHSGGCGVRKQAGVRNDVGIVFVPNRPFVIVVMTAYLKRESDGDDAIAKIAGAAYEYFDRLARASPYGRIVSERN